MTRPNHTEIVRHANTPQTLGRWGEQVRTDLDQDGAEQTEQRHQDRSIGQNLDAYAESIANSCIAFRFLADVTFHTTAPPYALLP